MKLGKKITAVVLLVVLMVSCWPVVASAYDMPYYIEVDLTNQIVTVYNTKDKSIARQMLCSSGVEDKTPQGVYYLPKKERDDERTEWYHMPNQYCWVKWCTKIYYAYFFHSITFAKRDDNTMFQSAIEEFGRPASHGCVRLRVEDAKFIAQNCRTGTYTKIYKSHEPDEELRNLLYICSYSQDDMSYQEFWGISEDGIGRGASGRDVLDLQHRLNDLGYYGGDYSGSYTEEVIASMKALQKDLGVKETGSANAELLSLIYSDEAPVAMGNVSVSEGASGPIVKSIQDSLAELGIYKGPSDSIYDAEVCQAVATFQELCGYTADGVATKEVQQAIDFVIRDIENTLGTIDYTTEFVPEELVTGVVKAKQKIIVRSDANSDSHDMGRVSNGDKVYVLDVSGDWAQIACSAGTGYIKKKYLTNPGQQTNYTLKFSANGKTYTLGATLAERASGSETIAKRVKEYVASEGFTDYQKDSTVTYATVDTSSVGQDVKLNLRAEPNTESEILTAVENGTSMRVLGSADGWTKVGMQDYIGYLMNDYLNIWEGTEDDNESVLASQGEVFSDEEQEEKTYCRINTGNVNLYAEATTNAEVVTVMGMDAILEILEVDDRTGWQHVIYNNMEGYVQSTYVTEPIGA